MFAQIVLVGTVVGIAAGGSMLVAQLAGRKLRTEKPVEQRSGARDLRTW